MFQGLPPLWQPLQSGAQVHPTSPPTDPCPLRRPATRPVLTRWRGAPTGAPEPPPRPVHPPPARTPAPRATLTRDTAPRRVHPADGCPHVREFTQWRDLHDVPSESNKAAAVSVSVPDIHARLRLFAAICGLCS